MCRYFLFLMIPKLEQPLSMFLFFEINRDTSVCRLLQKRVGDGVIIVDSLGKTSDSSRSHHKIGIECS